jgi:hypothetical protein
MPTRLRDLTDTDLQNLNTTKNKYVMKYNASTDKFDIVSSDSIVSSSKTSIPENFITQVEEEIDPNNIKFSGVDAGTF